MPTLAQAVPADYTTPPVYSGAAVQVIHGPVSGDSQLAQVQMDGQPCNILAEDPRSVMLTPPPGTAASLHPGTWHPAPNTPAFAFPSSNARPGGSRGLVAQGFSPRP